MKKLTVWIIATILGIAAVIIFVSSGKDKQVTTKQAENNKIASNELRDKCVIHEGLGMHIHPNLKIMIEAEQYPVPGDIGVSDDCMKPLHTHDTTGKLHVEYPETHDFTLKDFFAVWNKPFSKDQILGVQAGEGHVIVMTVDGQPSGEYENLVLKDNQQIIISFQHQ